MTQQRIPFLLCSWLLASVGCGGGDGAPVKPVDPNAPPAVADQQPSIPNQNPVNPISNPPDNSQPPNPPTTTPGTGTGGTCVELCGTLQSRGCMMPDGGCEQGCAELLAEDCGSQRFALDACALQLVCPEDIDPMDPTQLQAILARCRSEYQAVMSCSAANGND